MTAEEMWNEYSRRSGIDAEYDAWRYGDQTDLLAQLTLDGRKTATASAYPIYAREKTQLPEAGLSFDWQMNVVFEEFLRVYP